MTVKELIEKLSLCNQEAEVFVYSEMDEGMDIPITVYNKQQGADLYCKGDNEFLRLSKKYPDKDYVVIG